MASSCISRTSTASPCSSAGSCSSRFRPKGYTARKPGTLSTSPEAWNGSPATSTEILVPSITAASDSVARKRRAMRL